MAAVSKAVGGSLDLPAVLDAVTSTAAEVLAAEQVCLMLAATRAGSRSAA